MNKPENSFKSQMVTVDESVNPHVQSTQKVKRMLIEDKNDKNVGRQKDFNHHKNAWSNRVEAIRELQFSLVGDVVDTQQEPVSGDSLLTVKIGFSFIFLLLNWEC